MHNGKYQSIGQQVAHTTFQLSSLSYSTKGMQEKALCESCLRILWKKSQENGPLVETLQDRKNKRTRQKNEEEIGKRNQMTALRFHAWESYQTPLSSLHGK